MVVGDRLGRGLSAARDIRARVGGEVRDARLNAGISQRRAAASVGMSSSELGRIERAEIGRPTVDQLSRACAAVGLKLVARAYPDGDPIRDQGHLALLARFKALLPHGVRWSTEVPLPIPGDLRSWDGMARFPDGMIAVEAETSLRDLQALDRRIGLKQRDGAVDVVILLVSDTESNRRVLRVSRDALRSRFPLDSRAVLRAVRAGHPPGDSGVVML